jgi:hypothetical protein
MAGTSSSSNDGMIMPSPAPFGLYTGRFSYLEDMKMKGGLGG